MQRNIENSEPASVIETLEGKQSPPLPFQLFFEEMPEATMILAADSPRFTIVAATDFRIRATHTTRDSIGRGLFEVFPDNPEDTGSDSTGNLRASLERVLRTRQADTMPVQKYDVRGPDGKFEAKYWSPRNQPILSASGEVLYILHRAQDVTELMRASQQSDEKLEGTRAVEHEVIQHSQELSAAVRELRDANAKLAQLDVAKTTFFSNISHEFRTPLTLMLGPLEDALADTATLPSTAHRERLEIAHRNALRLLKLVNALLDFSRIEAGRLQAQFQATDLAAYTSELASNFRSALERGGLRFTVDCQPLPEPVYIDREMWEKIVLNLLSNAFKHTFEGAIAVRVFWHDGRAHLAIQDSGIGIPQEELPRLFERFHRVKNAASRTHEGTGIGLSLVRELVHLHQGSIDVNSQPGQGTCFTVTVQGGTSHLPSANIDQRSSSHATVGNAATFLQEALQWLPADIVGGHGSTEPADRAEPATKPRILWADDNPDMRHYVARLLGQNYEVVAVPDGAEALKQALTTLPDLVLSDVMMPKLDGFGLVRALRADQRTCRLPIILLSARAGEESSFEGLEAGADDYLMKPFSAKELQARVRSNLKLAQARREWEQTLAQTNQQLSEALLAKDRFLATMSHEIRTPLNAVIGMAGLLFDTTLTEEQREFAGTIRSSGDHLLTVINDILDYSRLESGKFPIEQIPYSVASIVEDAIDIVAGIAREKKLELSYELLPDVPDLVLGDPGRVRQVLLNLLSNALKFTAEGEIVVLVSMRSRADQTIEIEFSVRDTGIGLTSEQCGRLFQPFSQADYSTTRRYGGTGLGLAISRRLVELMGGRAWVESEIGLGSHFCFSVAAEVAEQASHRAAELAQLSMLAGSRVWIVDDNDTNRRILRRQVESWGMQARDTAFPSEALQWANNGDPCDLAILDFLMPDMDGSQLANELNRLRGNTLGQLLLSSVGKLPQGPYEQLTKPARHATLLSTMVKLIDARSRALASAARTSPAQGSTLIPMAQRMPLRILVAEDNPVNVKLITIMLGRLGYRPDIAGNGLEALDALRRQPYDLILMDVRMPEMDGIEATRIISQEWPEHRRPRVVAFTAGVMAEERRACLDAGVHAVLAKPIVPAELVQVLAQSPRLSSNVG